MNIDDFNNNILANRWKERYANQPNDIKKKLDTFENSDYQLHIIKRKSIGKVNSSSSRSQLELTIAKIVVEVTLPNFSLTG